MTDRPASIVPDPLKADCGLSAVEVALLDAWTAAAAVTEIAVIRRHGPDAFDLTIEGTREPFPDLGPRQFKAWLPLACIADMTDWTAPELARMTDHPTMAMSGDWSAVRDSRDAPKWAIFRHFVLDPWLAAGVQAEADRRTSAALDGLSDACPTCGQPCEFVAHFAAPGFGQSWKCPRGHDWVRLGIGGDFIDPSEQAHILTPGDVR